MLKLDKNIKALCDACLQAGASNSGLCIDPAASVRLNRAQQLATSVSDSMIKMQDDNRKMLRGMEHIAEYWNGSPNSAVNAAEVCRDIATRILIEIDPNGR